MSSPQKEESPQREEEPSQGQGSALGSTPPIPLRDATKGLYKTLNFSCFRTINDPWSMLTEPVFTAPGKLI